ncbi:hypothetical protein JCM5350_001918 [Sporobolomyces pararoseus]
MSDPPPTRVLRSRRASGQVVQQSSNPPTSQLDEETPTSRQSNRRANPPLAGPSSETSAKTQQPLPPLRPSKKREKKVTVLPPSDLSTEENLTPAEDVGEEEGVVVSRRRKAKERARSEENGFGNRVERDEESEAQKEDEQEREGQEEEIEGSNRIRIAASEDLSVIDEIWREKDRSWADRLRSLLSSLPLSLDSASLSECTHDDLLDLSTRDTATSKLDLAAHVTKDRNPMLQARYTDFASELMTFKQYRQSGGRRTTLGRLKAVKDRELHEQRLSKLRSAFWIAATALSFVCVSAEELHSALQTSSILAFVNLSEEDFCSNYQENAGAAAEKLAKEWRQSNPLPSDSNSPILLDKILSLLMEDMVELEEAEYVEGSVIRMTGSDDKPFKSPEVKLRLEVFDEHVARPSFFEFFRLLASDRFDEYRQAPQLRARTGPESSREPNRVQIYARADRPPSLALPLWSTETRVLASGQSRQTKTYTFDGRSDIVEVEVTPLEDRVLGIYGTINGVSYEWEKDFEKIVSQTRENNKQAAKELVKWKGQIVTLLSFLNTVFKATPMKESWTVEEEIALNEHLYNLLIKAFPKPESGQPLPKAYYPPSLLRERYPAIYGGRLVSKGMKTSGDRSDRVVLRNIPSMSRAGLVSRVASAIFSVYEDVSGCDELVREMALKTMTFTLLQPTTDSLYNSEQKLVCHDCNREDCELMTCKIAGFSVYLCHDSHLEYVRSAEAVSTETGKDNVNSLQNKIRSEGVPKSQEQIRKELSKSKGIDVTTELQIPEAYFGLTMINTQPTMALNALMSSFDCVAALPSEDGKKIIMHELLANVVYTTWPINAIASSWPRQILPLFAILIALRSLLHSSRLNADPDTFKSLESIALHVIDEVLEVIIRIHHAHRAIDLPSNKDATTLEVSDYFGENPFAYHLAKRQVYDKLLEECVGPNESHLLPGSEEWYRRNVSWLTKVPTSEVTDCVKEIQAKINVFVPIEKDGEKLACITNEMVKENMLSRDEWRRIESTAKKVAKEFAKSGTLVYGHCSDNDTVVSFLHPDEQKEWEKKTGRKWTVNIQHYHLIARGLRMLYECDRNYQGRPSSDNPTTRLQKAIITFFYRVYETNWSDPIVGRVKLLDRGSFIYGGFGHGRQRSPMTSILEGDSLSYESINLSRVPKPNIVLRIWELTRQLSRSCQSVEAHNKDFAPNENIKIFGRAVEDIFRHGRYNGMSERDQTFIADQLKSGLDDEEFRWDGFLRDVGMLNLTGASNVVGTQILRPSTAPDYLQGKIVILVLFAAAVPTVVAINFYIRSLNKKKEEKLQELIKEHGWTPKDVEREAAKAAFADLTDKENVFMTYLQ